MNKKRRWFHVFAILHGACITVLAFFLVQLDYMNGDEAWLTRTTSAILRLVVADSDKPDPKDFAFINVAWDKMLVDRIDGNGFPAGNRAIVDRNKLARFFATIQKQNPHKFIVCDVIFPDASPADSALEASIQTLPRCLFSRVRDDSGSIVPSAIRLPATGLADYRPIDNNFLKFILVRDTLKTMPLRMFEMIHQGKFERGGFVSWRNNEAAMNCFILDFRLRQFDLMRPDRVYAYSDLNALCDLIDVGQEQQVLDFVRNRIVVIGDFEDRDMHSTTFGDMAGPLILTNLYLALAAGDNLLSIWFFVFIFIIFWSASLMLFSGEDFLEKWLEKLAGSTSITWKFLLQGAAYVLFFGMASVVSYLLFKIHINFFWLAMYFNTFEFARVWVKAKRDKWALARAAKKSA